MTERDSSSISSTEITWGIWQGLDVLWSNPNNVPVAPEYIQHDHGPTRVRHALDPPSANQPQCMVPGCMRVDCKLVTHLRYKSWSTKAPRVQKKQDKRGSLALQQLQVYSSKIPSTDGVDGFPSLPIHEALDPNVRSLFHFFFTNTFDKLALLFRGPSVVDLADFKERMLGAALKSEVYCRSLILQARTEQDISNLNIEETQETLNLVNGTLKAFRQQLGTIHQVRHPLQIELALLVLCVLMMYDSAHDREDAQKVHWKGMRDLVAMRGGIHCVTMALAYVMHADRCCAIRFDVMPTYNSTLSQCLPLQIPPLTSSRYGSRFRAMRLGLTTIHQDVVAYLEDISGLVGLWQKSYTRITATNRTQRPGLSFEHLHYLRDRLDERFAVLNAQWARNDTAERCLLWASRIVEYPCTWANYVKPMTRDLSNRLAKTLQQKREIITLWRSDLDILLWILFALTTVEPLPVVRSWGVDCLRNVLTERYGGTAWPRTWRVDEQENLTRCVWLRPQYAGQYERVCDELERRSYYSTHVKNWFEGKVKTEDID